MMTMRHSYSVLKATENYLGLLELAGLLSMTDYDQIITQHVVFFLINGGEL